MAISHAAPRNDGNWIRIVVDAFEVSVHLLTHYAMSDQPNRVSGRKDGIFTLELNQLAQAGFPTLGVP